MPRRLEMADNGVELMAYLSLHGDASQDQLAGALWPRRPLQRGRQLLDEVVAEINCVVARTTGSLTPAIDAQGRVPGPHRAGRAPRVLVRVVASKPFVQVYDPDDSLPGEDFLPTTGAATEWDLEHEDALAPLAGRAVPGLFGDLAQKGFSPSQAALPPGRPCGCTARSS